MLVFVNQVGPSSLSPLRGFSSALAHPRLTPWAAFFAASRLGLDSFARG